LLNRLGQLWLSGVKIDWSGFYTHERRHRIPLPTYPFERQRYWIEPQKQVQAVPMGQVSLEKKPNMADWFYIRVWKQSMPPVPWEAGNRVEQKSYWLIFVDESGVGSQLAQRLENENQNVIIVRMGEKFSQLGERHYTLNPQQKEDYNLLLQNLRTTDQLPHFIVHAWTVQSNQQATSGIEQFEKTQHTGFYSLLFLAKALAKQLITNPLQIWVLSNNMHAVESTDAFEPDKTTVLGLCNVIPQEYTNITCRSIDFGLPQSGSRQEEKLIDQLLAELTTPSSDLTIAYRGNQRWLQDIESIKLDDRANRPTRLRQGGVYFITGGLGKLGFMLAEYLARRVQAKLVLIGRSRLPAPEEWQQWLTTHDEGDRVSTRIRKVQQLEELGAEVLVISADVANESQMQAAISQTEARFGRIHGVIHAAGIVEKDSLTPISETDYAECELHFQPKVQGLYTLEKVLRGRELDYCLLTSSISSILGGLGFAAYSSANIFMDAFAHQQNQLNHCHWCSTNWFLVDVAEEISEAFQRVLSNGLVPQIAISQIDLKVQIERWIKRKSWQGQENTNNREAAPSLYPRSNRRTPYVAPTNETERRIIKRYQELLGIEEVGIHDNFFDLGGNSLIGTQLIAQLRQDFQIELPLRFLLEAPCVSELALVIEALLIEKLEELAEEEVIATLEKAKSPI
jgi:acyl transferase domain-containing protein